MTVSVMLCSARYFARSGGIRCRHDAISARNAKLLGKLQSVLKGGLPCVTTSKNVFIPAENFVQLHDKDASSHGPFDRTTELRSFQDWNVNRSDYHGQSRRRYRARETIVLIIGLRHSALLFCKGCCDCISSLGLQI